MNEAIDSELDKIIQDMLVNYTLWVKGEPIAWNVKKREAKNKLKALLERNGQKQFENAIRWEAENSMGSDERDTAIEIINVGKYRLEYLKQTPTASNQEKGE